jgi:flavin reductase (DIM6/NTAB) family NADH-FMN oxidoreductase RutF
MEEIKNYFSKSDICTLSDNFVKTIGDDWLLITCGTAEKFNTMTASWGAMGVLWNKPIAIVFIRPTRFTYGFAESNDHFTLSFFTEKEKSILQYCGTKSGKDVDKIDKTGLIPLETETGSISFKQSRMVVECRKVYFDDLDPEKFLSPEIDMKNYPKKDYHRMYIGEVLNVWLKEQ